MKSVSRNLLLALVPIAVLGLCSSTRADVLTSNPANPGQGFQFGLFADPNTGARYGTIVDEVNQVGYLTPAPNSYDPFFNLNTSVRSAYGISATLSNGTTVSGYADPMAAGVHNIVATQFSSVVSVNGMSAHVLTFLNAGGPNLVQIDQSFNFAPNHPNIMIDKVTLTNLTNGPISSLTFRSLTDFTILNNQLNPNAVVNVPPFGSPITTVTGFPEASGGFPPANADPNAQPIFPQPQTGTFFPDNTANNLPDPPSGAGITLNLAGLAAFGLPGDATSFNLFYATAAFPGQSLADLEAEVSALGGNYQISGFNQLSDDSGNPAGFDLVIVAVETVSVPEPATFALFGIGLAGLAGWRRWRKRSI